ncbi:16S rRNA (uracil(1498)-N(3))-methyltransferase [Carnimonas nigrificans]|uniref:16S rRNA (uracil(1498)-N(3))-methyltransferase n=1 Tax=Carnimonas nigrificans TaxID=64323 RepID=UPI00046F9E5C|nr:16S rRNA (uracil(1498)-N(3))-methyltransferase [Carnimonas nigrificans]
MNLILFSQADTFTSSDGELRVRINDARRLAHLHQVHRAEEGKMYRLGEINGAMGRGELLTLTEQVAEFSFVAEQQPPAALNVHVLLALPRPRMLARSLENMAALGVKRITLINTARVEKSFWQSPELREEKIMHHLQLGLEQCCDTLMPQVDSAPRFKPFVEDQLPALLAERRGLVADPGAALPCPRGLPVETPLLLAIGPEGGFVDYELEQLQQTGVEGVQLGARILRVETAVVALLSRLY